jgi:F0F1-type ATP synthase membrane subunit b/b'
VQTLELAVEFGISAASAGVTGMGMLWTFARRMQRMTDETAEAKKIAEEAKQLVQKLDQEVDEDRRQGADQWQELNRTLGQIEGMMSGGPPPGPPRGKIPSRGR